MDWLMELYNSSVPQNSMNLDPSKTIDQQLYNVQSTSTQTITWETPSGVESEHNSFQSANEGPQFLLMTPEQHAAYLSSLYPAPSGLGLLDTYPYEQVQNNYNPIQYVNYTPIIQPVVQPTIKEEEKDEEEEEEETKTEASEDMTPMAQHDLLKMAVERFQWSNRFKNGGGGQQESTQPFLTSDQLATLMTEFPQLVAQPSQSPPLPNAKQNAIPKAQQTPLQRMAAMIPPLLSQPVPKPSRPISRPPTLSPQITQNELLEASPLVSPVSSVDSWGASFEQIASMPCPLQPRAIGEPSGSKDSEFSPKLTCPLEPSKFTTNTPYSRPSILTKRQMSRIAKAGRHLRVQRPEINFLDAKGLEVEIGSHLEMEVSQLMQLIAEFMAKNEISRLQVAHMTDTNSFYISWFLEGKHEDIHPDCKLIFITWYLNCSHHPEKLEEYMSYPTIQPSLDMSFSKAQQEILMAEFKKTEKVNVAKIVEDINRKVPRTIKSATMTSKLVLHWYRSLTAKNREKKKLQGFPNGLYLRSPSQ